MPRIAKLSGLNFRGPDPKITDMTTNLDFLRELGVERVRSWNHDTLWAGVEFLQQRWGGRSAAPPAMSGSMIALELPEDLGSTTAEADSLRDALLFEDRIEVPIEAWRGRFWTRLSVQVYNDLDDFQRLADAVDSRRRPGQ